MAIPVPERVLADFATRLARSTAANGYTYDVGAIVRRRRGEAIAPWPGTVFVGLDAMRRSEDVIHCEPWVAWDVDVAVIAFIEQRDPRHVPGESPSDEVVLTAARDLNHAVNPSGDTTEGPPGGADFCALQDIQPFPVLPGELAGCTLNYRARVLTSERDLAKGRVDG